MSEGRISSPPAQEAGALDLSSGLECASERNLRAQLELLPEEPGDRPYAEEVRLPAPGWKPPPEAVCGRYTLKGALVDDTGTGTTETLKTGLQLGPAVRLEQNPQAELKAVCGEGARIALADLARPAPDSCQTPRYTWQPGGETPSAQDVAEDGTVTLRTVNQDFNTLLGEQVEGTLVARKGDSTDALSIATRITTEPFIQVERTTELPAASETGLVGVLVRLTNTIGCDVSEVDYVERLEGLSFVGGSARLDGEALDALAQGDGFQVKLPRLEAGATRTLSYVARPHLLGERRLTGEATKNTVRLSRSDATGMPPREGCGCTSASGAPMFLVLALLGGVSRRRRHARDGAAETTARS